MDINKFLGETEKEDSKEDQWSKVIQPASSYLVLGDMNTGKSGLAYWLLERFSEEYSLSPTVVGIPKTKRTLLPGNFVFLDTPDECTGVENAIVFIDEADLQLPMDNQKLKQYVVNFLSLPFHRNQIFIMAFHYPRLVMGTYLPFFTAFLLKRPPYLLEFASKGQSKAVMGMMEKAEERFAEIPSLDDVVKNTYVVAPRLRWQGMLENPLASFWSDELRAIWAGVGITERQGERLVVSDQLKLSALLQRQDEAEQSDTMKRLAKVQSLFPNGIPFGDIIEYDKHFTLEQLRQQCRDAGISISGDKKMLCAKLIAKEQSSKQETNQGGCFNDRENKSI